MNGELDEAIKSRLATAQNTLIASHVRPDGDAIGSLLAMGLALQNGGKKVQMVLADGLSALLQASGGLGSDKDPHRGTV